MDVDFGLLGSAGAQRGGFGNLGVFDPVAAAAAARAVAVPATTTTTTKTTWWQELPKYLQTGTDLVAALKPTKKPSNVVIVQQGGGGGGGLPAWALPAAGLAVAGGLAYVLFSGKAGKRRR